MEAIIDRIAQWPGALARNSEVNITEQMIEYAKHIQGISCVRNKAAPSWCSFRCDGRIHHKEFFTGTEIS